MPEMDLRMLVLAGGHERTLDDYAALTADAGLRTSKIHHEVEGYVIIECVPA
jgi:hypothetical protein